MPLIREKFSEPVDRVAHDAAEHIVEVFSGINITGLAGLDDAQEQGRSMSPALSSFTII